MLCASSLGPYLHLKNKNCFWDLEFFSKISLLCPDFIGFFPLKYWFFNKMMQKRDSYPPFDVKMQNSSLRVVYNLYLVDSPVWSHMESQKSSSLTFFAWCLRKSCQKWLFRHQCPKCLVKFGANADKFSNSVKRVWK